LPTQEAYTVAAFFFNEGFDSFEVQDCGTHSLAGLVVEVAGETKPFLLLCPHDAAAEIIPLGRALVDKVMRCDEGLSQFMYFLDIDRWHRQWAWQSHPLRWIAQCAD
jgi:hypothetical protein